MANLGVVLASACIVCPIAAGMALLRREAIFLIISISVIAILGYNGTIGLANALVLISAAIAFNYFVLRSAGTERAARRVKMADERPNMERWRMALYIIFGLGLLVLGSELVLRGGVGLAIVLGVDEFTIGLTIVALGTTMPELAVSLTSACRRETNLLLGNVLGSNISNSLLSIGLAGLFTPVTVPMDFFTLALPMTLAMYTVLVLFMFKKRKLNRNTGIMFLGIYAAYLVLLLI